MKRRILNHPRKDSLFIASIFIYLPSTTGKLRKWKDGCSSVFAPLRWMPLSLCILILWLISLGNRSLISLFSRLTIFPSLISAYSFSLISVESQDGRRIPSLVPILSFTFFFFHSVIKGKDWTETLFFHSFLQWGILIIWLLWKTKTRQDAFSGEPILPDPEPDIELLFPLMNQVLKGRTQPTQARSLQRLFPSVIGVFLLSPESRLLLSCFHCKRRSSYWTSALLIKFRRKKTVNNWES